MPLPMLALVAACGPGSLGSAAGVDTELPLDRLRLPPGFEISVWARVEDARSLALGSEGTVFVGNRRGDSVWALRDADGDGVAEARWRIASGLEMPNGVAFREGSLYVAEVKRILRFDGIEAHLDRPAEPVVVSDRFPTERHHGWKFIAFGPDGKLYVPVGAPCNICLPTDGPFASITRMNPDGSDLEVYADGVRNTVGFDWHPETGVLWFTDNGRDWMGDDRPPDELNRAPEPGLHFGFPFCHGGDIPDPEFGSRRSCEEFVAPEARLGPHVAALGMRFYDGAMFPAGFHGQILIAEHGSWNRSSKIGYRVMVARQEGGSVTEVEPFVEGWLQGERAWGRPVDVLVMPDGSLLVSDDHAGAIYRVTYTSP
jgi:glucose/arabinose dehydrogenase